MGWDRHKLLWDGNGTRAVESESESRSRKDFQPEESES